MLQLGRLRPALLALALPSGTEAQPIERLVPSHLDLGGESGLCSRGADVVRKREVGLSLGALTLPEPGPESLAVDSVRFSCDPVERPGPDRSDDGLVAFGSEE